MSEIWHSVYQLTELFRGEFNHYHSRDLLYRYVLDSDEDDSKRSSVDTFLWSTRLH
ncbi:MAG: hypothetical protein R3F19_12715 [Verrucomicrobiales bacterium]